MRVRDYDLQTQLGKGSQGVVWRAKRKVDGALVAIKQIMLRSMSRHEQAAAVQEGRVLAKLKHPHVIKYLGSFQEGTVLNIVTELAESGSLYDVVKKRKGAGAPLAESQIWKYFVQTALGLQHIHAHKILHRDVKTMNIFLSSRDEVKVGDLGVAKVLGNTMDMAQTMVGTPYYLSPELCEGKPYNDKSDVWSLGCVLYELCTLRHPFDASNQGALIIKIIRGRYPPLPASYSASLSEILDLCLERDTRRRPDAVSLLGLPQVVQHAAALQIRLTAPAGSAKEAAGLEDGSPGEKRASNPGKAPEVRGSPFVDKNRGHGHAPPPRQHRRPPTQRQAPRHEGEGVPPEEQYGEVIVQDRDAGRRGGFIPAGPSARGGFRDHGLRDGLRDQGLAGGGGALANFLRPAGIPSRPASARPASAAFGGGGGARAGGVIIGGGLLGGGERAVAADRYRAAPVVAVSGAGLSAGQREYGGERPGGPPRLFTAGGGGRARPASAGPVRRAGGVGGAVGEEGEVPAASSRAAVVRQRPGMPAAIQEKLRERQRSRLCRPSAPKSSAVSGEGERQLGAGGDRVRPGAVDMTPTTPSPAMGFAAGRAGAHPVFFPPSAPIPRASSRAPPTSDDLVRREVRDLPDRLSLHTLKADACGGLPGASGQDSMEVSMGASRRQSNKAAEGHDDLLTWFRELVVADAPAPDGAQARDEIWEGRQRSKGKMQGIGRAVGSLGADGDADGQDAAREVDGHTPACDQVGEGVMVWGEGGRGRLGKNPVRAIGARDEAWHSLAVAQGEREAVGDRERSGDVEGDGGCRVLPGAVAGPGGTDLGEHGLGGAEEDEETEEERRERLLAILKSRELLKRPDASRGDVAMEIEHVKRRSGPDQEGCRFECDETISGGEDVPGSGSDSDDDDLDEGSRGIGYTGHVTKAVGCWGAEGDAGSGVMDAIMGPAPCRGAWAAGMQEVEWRLVATSPGAHSATVKAQSALSRAQEREREREHEHARTHDEAGFSDSTLSRDDDTSETDASDILATDDADGQGGDEGGGEGDSDEMQQRQRAKLLAAALGQAKDALLASLGREKFARLYAAVMESDTNDVCGRESRARDVAEGGQAGAEQGVCGDGGGGEPESGRWGSNEHGWQMLQLIYLEEETKRLHDRICRV